MEQYAKVFLTYTTVPGEVYRFKFTANLANQGFITAIAYDFPSATFINHYPIASNGTYYMDILASSASTEIAVESAVGGTRVFYLDNVSLERRPFVYANDLTTSLGQMTAYGTAVTLSTENRRLKASGLKQWEGVKCVIATVPGRRYRVNYTIDLAGGGSAKVAVKGPGIENRVVDLLLRGVSGFSICSDIYRSGKRHSSFSPYRSQGRVGYNYKTKSLDIEIGGRLGLMFGIKADLKISIPLGN